MAKKQIYERIFEIAEQISNLYLCVIKEEEKNIVDKDGLPNLDFSFNNSNDDNPSVISFKKVALSAFKEIRDLCKEEKALYECLTLNEVIFLKNELNAYDDMNYLNLDSYLLMAHIRVSNHLYDRICHLSPELGYTDSDILLIDRIMFSAQIIGFRIQRHTIKKYNDGSAAKLHKNQVLAKYTTFSMDYYSELCALDANYDIYSMEHMSPIEIKRVLKEQNEKGNKKICNYIINHIIETFKKNQIEYPGIISIASACVNSDDYVFVLGLINCLPKDALSQLLEQLYIFFPNDITVSYFSEYIKRLSDN